MKLISVKQATENIGGLSNPSKMPDDSQSFGISAKDCKTGSQLAKIPGSICEECYALGGFYIMASTTKAHDKRIQKIYSPEWVPSMIALAKRKPFFRWFDSGDIQSMRMLTNIVKIAVAVPTTTFWLPTKENKMVASYLKKHGAFPNNLIVRVSAPMIDGQPPKRFELTSTVHKVDAPIGHECNAHNQDNKCMDCRACWNPSIKNISYKYHQEKMKMKTYEITIDVRETRRFEVKANSEEEAENKLYMRVNYGDTDKTESEDVSFIDWVDGDQEIIDIEEVE